MHQILREYIACNLEYEDLEPRTRQSRKRKWGTKSEEIKWGTKKKRVDVFGFDCHCAVPLKKKHQIHLSLLNDGLATFGSMEGSFLIVAGGRDAHQVLLRLVASAHVDAVLERVEAVLVPLAS